MKQYSGIISGRYLIIQAQALIKKYYRQICIADKIRFRRPHHMHAPPWKDFRKTAARSFHDERNQKPDYFRYVHGMAA